MAKDDKRSLFEKLIRSGSDEDIKRAMSIYDEMDRRLAKRYGLLFERGDEETFGTETFQSKLKGYIPTPHYVPELSVRPVPNADGRIVNNNGNLLLEGDNLHWLTVLQQTHKSAIDVIYADPPYNTGDEDGMTYNNNYISKTDKWRHSKWLSIMEKRLVLAKSLLKPTGVICVTIDDYEIATLTLLMNEIFGEDNRLGTVMIRNMPAGRGSDIGRISICHEYALLYGASNIARLKGLPHSEEQKKRYDNVDEDGSFFEWVSMRRHGTDCLRKGHETQFFPIFAKRDASGWRLPNMNWIESRRDYEILEEPLDDEVSILPITDSGEERRWILGLDTLLESPERVRISRKRGGKLVVDMKQPKPPKGAIAKSLWLEPKYDAGEHGSELLTSIFGQAKPFDFPKSLYAVIDCLKVCGAHKDATVLDMYAGSATTAHAVMELNKEDDGHRRWIMLTNNEFRDGDYLVEIGALPPRPVEPGKKNKTEIDKAALAEWNRQADEFHKTEDFKKISDTGEYKANGICRAITKKRIDAVITGKRVSDGAKWAEPMGGGYDFATLILEEPLPISRRLRMMRKSKATTCLVAIKERISAAPRDKAKGLTILESDEKVVVISPRVPGSKQMEAIRNAFNDNDKARVLYVPIDECQSLSVDGWDELTDEGVRFEDIDVLLLANDYIQKNA